MINRVIVTNSAGESITYKIQGVQQDDASGLLITNIDGLGPVKANVAMSQLATVDGSQFNSVRIGGRNIVFTALFTNAPDVEASRHLSYRYFPVGEKVNVTVETDTRTVSVDGYVESNEPTIFEKETSCQVSILCESPFFEGEDIVLDLTGYHGTNRTMNYPGDIGGGVEIIAEVTRDDNALSWSEVSGLTITHDGTKSINLDFSKMSGIVPITKNSKNCIYAMRRSLIESGNGFRHFESMPYDGFAKTLVATGDGECRLGGSAVFLNGELHVLGGWTRTASKYHYKWNGEEWVRLNDLPYMFVNGCAVVVGGLLHILGSIVSGEQKKHYTYNAGTDTWSVSRALPYKFMNGCVVVDSSNRIIILGGDTRKLTYTTDTMYSLEPDSDGTEPTGCYRLYGSSWTASANQLPYNFWNGAAYITNNIIHILGGISIHQATTGNYKKHYTASSFGQAWEEQTDLPVGIYDKSMVVRLPNTGDVYIFDWAKHVWHEEPQSGGGTAFVTASDVGTPPLNFTNICTCVNQQTVYILIAENQDTSEIVPPDNTNLYEGDIIVISTVRGKKGVYLYRKGKVYSIVNAISGVPEWFTLHTGSNVFRYDENQTDGYISIKVKSRIIYAGI